MPASKGDEYLRALLDDDKPARTVGLFTAHALKPEDVERLVDSCIAAMRETNGGADVAMKPLTDGVEPVKMWRLTMREGADAKPHDCLLQLYDMRGQSSPHRALFERILRTDEELATATRRLQANAVTYLQFASGKLDHDERVHPFENLVSLFATALNAAIVDSKASMVTMDPVEWVEALEESLEMERELGEQRR
ncbi:MAG TPA: hypothetical protein VGH20_20450 [Myxococcales bacterium]|jgi:hypothetical protein